MIEIDLIQQLMQNQQEEHPTGLPLEQSKDLQQPQVQNTKQGHPAAEFKNAPQESKDSHNPHLNSKINQHQLPEARPQAKHQEQPQKAEGHEVAKKSQQQKEPHQEQPQKAQGHEAVKKSQQLKGSAPIDDELVAKNKQFEKLERQIMGQDHHKGQREQIKRVEQHTQPKRQQVELAQQRQREAQDNAEDQQDKIDIDCQPNQDADIIQEQVIVEHQMVKVPEDQPVPFKHEITADSEHQRQAQARHEIGQGSQREVAEQVRPKSFQQQVRPSPSKQQGSQKESQSGISLNELYRQQLQKATQAKQQGNQLFKRNLFTQALQFYNTALVYLNENYFVNASPQIFNLMCEQKSNICNNICATLLLQEKPRQAQVYAKESLKINPKNRKTAFRLAMVYKAQQRFEQAYILLKDILVDGGTEQEIQTFKVIKQLYKKQRKIVGESMNGFLTKRPSQQDVQDKSKGSQGSSWLNTLASVTVAGVGVGALAFAISKFVMKSQKSAMVGGIASVISGLMAFMATVSQPEQTPEKK